MSRDPRGRDILVSVVRSIDLDVNAVDSALTGALRIGGAMTKSYEARITGAILDAYHAKLSRSLVADVLVVGAGPSGLMAARALATRGREVVVLEKALCPGGGIWGGAFGMNEVVAGGEAVHVLEEIGVRTRMTADGLAAIDAMELAPALILGAVRAGAVVLNLTTVEDLCVHDGAVRGVVANRTGLIGRLPMDPISFQAVAVLDATGHDASLVHMLHRRGLLKDPEGVPGEGAMDAMRGEALVVDQVTEVYPGLWIAGMCVAAVRGSPRMGPIFGGMLLSGQAAGELIDLTLALDAERL
jgi:thiamine thiazole synthase